MFPGRFVLLLGLSARGDAVSNTHKLEECEAPWMMQ